MVVITLFTIPGWIPISAQQGVTIRPVPKDPVVPTKVDLPAKNFTESVEGSIRVPDPSEPNNEAKVKYVPSKATFEMVYIPGGSFLMGSPESEDGREEHEGPQHRVTLRAFWMAKVETTWDLYDLWYRNGSLPRRDEADSEFESKNKGKKLKSDAITRPTNPYVDDTYGHQRAGKPAICMSHHAAMMFCHWLRLQTQRPYRLPTEAEWEFAARAGHKGPYGFNEKTEKLADYAWYDENSKTDTHPEGTTHPVGKKKANSLGLHDLHGNVAEWCLDHYDPKYYGTFDPMKEALGPVNKPTDKKWAHVTRGGSWRDPATALRSAARYPSEIEWMDADPNRPRSIWWLTEMDQIGFRFVLPTEEYDSLKDVKPLVMKWNQLK
jgi:formylglycine-generating enzyme required for sulfatase activity